ncbi:hypothetical protein LOTGIDRAFT_175268, partial [Lottia gigantea]
MATLMERKLTVEIKPQSPVDIKSEEMLGTSNKRRPLASRSNSKDRDRDSLLEDYNNTRFIQLNINGLNVPERKTQLVQLLQRKQYDAVFLQESKLGSRNKDPIINDYTLIRLNRPNALNHRSGGGLAIYIKNGISHSEVPLKTIAPLEAQAVSFTDKSKVFSIVNIYRPEVKGKPQRFSEYQYVYDQLPGTDNIVLGDFNAKHVLWGSPTTDTNGRQVAEFIEANDLVSINDGSITYVGAIAPLGSHLDLTL